MRQDRTGLVTRHTAAPGATAQPLYADETGGHCLGRPESVVEAKLPNFQRIINNAIYRGLIIQ